MLKGLTTPLGGGGLGIRKAGAYQRLAGMPVYANSGSGTFTATKACRVLIYAWGGGGAGDGGGALGSGAGAIYHEVYLKPGQAIAYSVGAGGASPGAGGDTTVTLPSGAVLRAGGGQTGSNPVLGGVASGAMINRTGATTTGLPNGSRAGGFPEHASDLDGGAGGSVTGTAPGGGGGQSASSAGGAGRVILLPFRLY